MKQSTKLSARIKRSWKVLGPGMITGASDDDPSGIATYSQAGAGFGLSTLWTALITFPLMAAVQEMCARIGAVTSRGLSGVLKQHYPPAMVYLIPTHHNPTGLSLAEVAAARADARGGGPELRRGDSRAGEADASPRRTRAGRGRTARRPSCRACAPDTASGRRV